MSEVLDKILQFALHQPGGHALLTGMGAVLVAVALSLFKRRTKTKAPSAAEKTITGKEYGPFTKLVELLGAIVSVIVVLSLVSAPGEKVSHSTWCQIAFLLLCAAVCSFYFLNWGANQDRR